MSFERLSVLVVEDSAFVRMTMNVILRALKVGRIVTANDGADAIQIIKNAQKNAATAHLLGFDMILSDYVMSPINGAMLLRWVRQHEESLDRFVPFVMVSGVADSERVRECRDLGVTEFLAKPFSVKAVGDHLLTGIENPRPFLFNKTYFGPDRRRQKRSFNDAERRVLPKSEIEVLHSGQRLKSINPKAKVYMFQLPNRLREKVGGISKEGLVIDPDVLKEAEQALERMDTDYADWVKGSVRQLIEAYKRAASDDASVRQRVEYIHRINKLAHDLRGQGTTFGYPLITIIGRSLYESTDRINEVGDQLLGFVKAHIDAMHAVIRDRIKGNGGEVGAELVASLDKAREKLADAHVV